MKKASTRLLEQETQTPSPAPDLIPAESSTENLHWDWYSKRGHFRWMMSAGILALDTQQQGGHSMFITRRGSALKAIDQFRDFRQASLLSPKLLHPIISEKAWLTFIRGKYDTDVFEAFKEVEIAVRTAGKYDARLVGIDLMRKAFHPDNGPLSDMSLPMAEREALMFLFSGAIGSYKNPASHRTVQISDPTEAGEMLIIASHLMRIVEDRVSRLKSNNP